MKKRKQKKVEKQWKNKQKKKKEKWVKRNRKTQEDCGGNAMQR